MPAALFSGSLTWCGLECAASAPGEDLIMAYDKRRLDRQPSKMRI